MPIYDCFERSAAMDQLIGNLHEETLIRTCIPGVDNTCSGYSIVKRSPLIVQQDPEKAGAK